MIITIDGPIATGKSTIAKALAKEVGYIYFDTGAMYRCLTCGIIKKNVNYDDAALLAEFLKHFKFEVKLKHGEKRYFIENEDVTDEIRLEKVTSLVSQVSAVPEVRKKLVDLQRELALGVNAIFEGRDMGSVVFPEAQIKVFLTGSLEIRAKRRFEEMHAKYPEATEHLTLEQVVNEINQRDSFDMNRKTSPLRQAEDALVIDTSNLSLQEIVLKILEYKDSRKTQKQNGPNHQS
jgi:CMP/dCMP kinase